MKTINYNILSNHDNELINSLIDKAWKKNLIPQQGNPHIVFDCLTKELFICSVKEIFDNYTFLKNIEKL